MAVTVISTNTFVNGLAYTPTTAGDDLYVLPNVTLMSRDSNAVSTNLANVTLHIDGTLVGFSRAVTFDSGATFGHLYIGAAGTVRAFNATSNDAAIVLFGAESGITNHGVITAPEAIGVYVGGVEGDILNTGSITGATGVQLAPGSNDSRLVNYGTITGSNQFDGGIDAFEGRGVVVQSADAYVLNGATGIIGSTATGGSGLLATGNSGGLVFNNFGGVWAAAGIGIDLSNVSAGQSAVTVFNNGTITGANGAYVGSGNEDTLINRSEMIGDVLMGDGEDTLYNRNGTIEGVVNMGDGNDRLVLGAGIEIADGGAGSDTVDLRHGTGGIIDLTGEGRGTGLALGDVLTGFERVYGSSSGVDRVFGNDANNAIYTYDGNDVILGGAGADTMYGGRGADRLTGGTGNDTFGYASVEDFGDIITDFSSSATGNNDRFQFRLSGVDAGVEAGTLSAARFQTRADNEAQDTNDRFIFRTTDKTLWFDADGSRDGDPVMVADLQDSATVTALDIVFL